MQIIHQLMTITADDRCLFMLFFCCFKNCDALTLSIPTTQCATKALRQMTESWCTTPLDLDWNIDDPKAVLKQSKPSQNGVQTKFQKSQNTVQKQSVAVCWSWAKTLFFDKSVWIRISSDPMTQNCKTRSRFHRLN